MIVRKGLIEFSFIMQIVILVVGKTGACWALGDERNFWLQVEVRQERRWRSGVFTIYSSRRRENREHKFPFQQIKLQEAVNYPTTARVEAAAENQHFQWSACAAAVAVEGWKNHLTLDL